MLDDGRALISSVSITALLLLRKYLIEMLLEEHVMSQTDELMCTWCVRCDNMFVEVHT